MLIAALTLFCVITFAQIMPAVSFVAAFYLLARSISAIRLLARIAAARTDEWTQRAVAWLVDGLALLLPDLDRFTCTAWLVDRYRRACLRSAFVALQTADLRRRCWSWPACSTCTARTSRPACAAPPRRPFRAGVRWCARGSACVLRSRLRPCSRRPAPAEALPHLPSASVLRAASLGDPIPLAQLLDAIPAGLRQPARHQHPVPGARLRARRSVARAHPRAGPGGQYPLMMASQVYAQVPDERKQRQMLEFVYRQFLADPEPALAVARACRDHGQASAQ